MHNLNPLVNTNWSSVQPRNSQFGSKLAMFFLSRVTFKFDGWPWKTIWHLFYTRSSSMHDFKTIGEFKLELQSRNSQFGSKLIFFLIPCNLEIWRMTLKNNMAPLLYYVKLYAPFQTIGEFKLELQYRKSYFGSRLEIFFAVWPWNLTDDLEKPYSTSSILCQVECIISNHWWIQTGVTVQKLSKLAGFFAAWLWNLTDDIEKQQSTSLELCQALCII